MIRTAVDSIRVAGRATQGVIVMRFKEDGDQVISMALTDKEEAEPVQEDGELSQGEVLPAEEPTQDEPET